MILVDYTNVASASLFRGLYQNDPSTSDAASYLLGKIRNYNVDFRKEFGELILCADSWSWRTKFWPNYKARRRALREKQTEVDEVRKELFEKIHEFWNAFVDHSKFRCLRVPGAEGDDVIATLARTPGKHVVISADKDIAQLTRYENVKAFFPVGDDKRFVDNGADFWHRLVIRGDKGDDVPNIISDPDTFVTPGKRMRPLRAKILDRILEADDPREEILRMEFSGISSVEVLANYDRNSRLVDLSKIPRTITERILEAYQKAGYEKQERKGDTSALLMKLRCPSYLGKLDDFVPAPPIEEGLDA